MLAAFINLEIEAHFKKCPLQSKPSLKVMRIKIMFYTVINDVYIMFIL